MLFEYFSSAQSLKGDMMPPGAHHILKGMLTAVWKCPGSEVSGGH